MPQLELCRYSCIDCVSCIELFKLLEFLELRELQPLFVLMLLHVCHSSATSVRPPMPFQVFSCSLVSVTDCHFNHQNHSDHHDHPDHHDHLQTVIIFWQMLLFPPPLHCTAPSCAPLHHSGKCICFTLSSSTALPCTTLCSIAPWMSSAMSSLASKAQQQHERSALSKELKYQLPLH